MFAFPKALAEIIVGTVVGMDQRSWIWNIDSIKCISCLNDLCMWKETSGNIFWIDVCDRDKQRCCSSAVFDRILALMDLLSPGAKQIVEKISVPSGLPGVIIGIVVSYGLVHPGNPSYKFGPAEMILWESRMSQYASQCDEVTRALESLWVPKFYGFSVSLSEIIIECILGKPPVGYHVDCPRSISYIFSHMELMDILPVFNSISDELHQELCLIWKGIIPRIVD